jgi:hypothetical protein
MMAMDLWDVDVDGGLKCYTKYSMVLRRLALTGYKSGFSFCKASIAGYQFCYTIFFFPTSFVLSKDLLPFFLTHKNAMTCNHLGKI